MTTTTTTAAVSLAPWWRQRQRPRLRATRASWPKPPLEAGARDPRLPRAPDQVRRSGSAVFATAAEAVTMTQSRAVTPNWHLECPRPIQYPRAAPLTRTRSAAECLPRGAHSCLCPSATHSHDKALSRSIVFVCGVKKPVRIMPEHRPQLPTGVLFFAAARFVYARVRRCGARPALGRLRVGAHVRAKGVHDALGRMRFSNGVYALHQLVCVHLNLRAPPTAAWLTRCA